MQKQFCRIAVILVSLMFILTGCATRRTNQELVASCAHKPSTVVVAQVSGLQNAVFVKEGESGLLDLLVNELMTDSVHKKIREIEGISLVEKHYYVPFEKGLEERSWKVQVERFAINRKELKEFKDEAKFAPHDFRFLQKKYGCEYALVLDPKFFGVWRQYKGFFPTSKPMPKTCLCIYLVKLSDNTLAGYYNSAVDFPVEGDWDTPPDFTALVAAIKKSLAKALSDAHVYFFTR